MVEIRVPVERLREVSKSLETRRHEADSLLQSALSLVDGLYGEWSGLAQVDYAQMFNDQVPPMRARFNEIVERLASELHRIADVFEETDQNVLPGSGGGGTPPPTTQDPGVVPTPSPGGETPPVDIDFDNMTHQEFVDYMGKWAQQSDRETGVPTSVTIAQAILETGWGKHTIGEANNLFGIKGEGPAGSVLVPTKEYQNGEWVTVMAKFAKYHSFEESIAAHAKLIANSRYYTEAMKYQNDPRAFAQKLEGVYATDPQYAEKLISIMDQYDLYRFDV